jgi:hypothetical protein
VGNGIEFVVVATADTAIVAHGAPKEGVENLDAVGGGSTVND